MNEHQDAYDAAWERLHKLEPFSHPVFGTLYERIVDFAADVVPCEIEYTDRHGIIVGYWAYGSFDPNLPYQGDAKIPTSTL